MKENLFIVPYWKYSLQNWPDIKKRIKNLLKQYPCKLSKNQNFLSNRHSAHYHHATPGFVEEIIKIFSDPLQEFAQEVKYNLKIKVAWATSYQQGMDHILHSHGKCLFTSIVYVDFDPDHHKGTSFKQPFNQFDSGDVCFRIPKVKEGDMIVCPSNIEHYGPVNTSPLIKTIIGFDLY
tara:strand:- start:3634 stop:4167 length:534 start_codon:yes stop_codon:yes gene_type:complete